MRLIKRSQHKASKELTTKYRLHLSICMSMWIQTLALEAATWTFVSVEMHQRIWIAPMRLALEFPRHPAAALWVWAGEIHVNFAPLSTQVSQNFVSWTVHTFYDFYLLVQSKFFLTLVKDKHTYTHRALVWGIHTPAGCHGKALLMNWMHLESLTFMTFSKYTTCDNKNASTWQTFFLCFPNVCCCC